MKIILPQIFLLLLFVTNSTFAQISPINDGDIQEIGETKDPQGYIAAKLAFIVKNNVTIYLLAYKDQRFDSFTKYAVVKFVEKGGTLDSLYEILMTAYRTGKEKKFKLGDKYISVTSHYLFGINTLEFADMRAGYVMLNDYQINQLFNKN